MPANVTLEFLGAQMERMLARQDALQDDMRVVTAIVLRHENTLNSVASQIREMLQQMRAMVAQPAFQRSPAPARGAGRPVMT